MKKTISYLFMGFIVGSMTQTLWIHHLDPPRDYSLDVLKDSVVLWDGARQVSRGSISQIDSLILNDNQ